MPGRRGAGIYISGTIRARIRRTVVVRRWSAGSASICRVRGSRPLRRVIWPLRGVILRALLIRPLLILVWALLRLVLPLRILIRPLLILIRPLLVLVRPLLISVWPLIRRSVLPGLELGIAELPHRGATIGAALGGNGSHSQKKDRAEKQDRSGDCRRTHSFRVRSPVHKFFSERALLGAWLPASGRNVKLQS